MTYEEKCRVIATVSFPGCPLGTHLWLEERAQYLESGLRWQHGLFAEIFVPERDTRERIPVGYGFDVTTYKSADKLLDKAYEMVRGLWLHELDERWQVDGVRTRDPHKPAQPVLPARHNVVDL